MSRTRKDDSSRAAMCDRLLQLIDVVYRDTDTEMAERLGYTNPSTFYRVRKRLAFPDVERLERLVQQAPAPKVMVNLNWLVAGVGSPLFRIDGRQAIEELSIGQFVDEMLVKR